MAQQRRPFAINIRTNDSVKAQWRYFIAGLLLVIVMWQMLVNAKVVHPLMLPGPGTVLRALPEILTPAIFKHLGYSMSVNLLGYLEAIVISLILGFAMALIPEVRAMFFSHFSALRFLPLAAVVYMYVGWFGIDTNMKVQFLATSVILYLVPTVVNRVTEIYKNESELIDTAITLGATKWQTIRSVIFPLAMSNILLDIMVLTAISWTYIILAESSNLEVGIGGMIYKVDKAFRKDIVILILGIIMAAGTIQDQLIKKFRHLVFKHTRGD